MDILRNKNASIQISGENLEKLKNILEQLNINFDQITEVPSDGTNLVGDDSSFTSTKVSPNKINLVGNEKPFVKTNATNDKSNSDIAQEKYESDSDKNNDNVHEEEDILDPLYPDDLDDSLDGSLSVSDDINDTESREVVTDVGNSRSRDINIIDNANDMNEITPDDIIDDNDDNNDDNNNSLKHNSQNNLLFHEQGNILPLNNTRNTNDDELDLASDEDETITPDEISYYQSQTTIKNITNDTVNNPDPSQTRQNTTDNTINNLNIHPQQITMNNTKLLPQQQKYISINNNKQADPITQKMPINVPQNVKTLQTYNNSNSQVSSIAEQNFQTNKNKTQSQLVNKLTKMEILKMENKITLNVGGKKFNIKKNLLEYLNINYGRLHKIIKDERIIYFMDKDPYYFSKIMALVKLYGFDQEKILEHINDYSEQLINELCLYGLLDKKFNPRPKLRLKRTVTFPSRHDDIVKIIAGEQLFETSSGVLSRSNYFDTKLKLSRSKQFYLSDIDPKIFRYVLNFLRTGELYVNNADIIELLNNYGIEYEKLENKKINENIVSHYIPHNLDSVYNQLFGCINVIDPRTNPIPNTNSLYQFIDNKLYYPENMLVSPNVENINIISTDSKLIFGSEIVFNLTDVSKNLGECIEDLLLCIDIPVLKPTEQVEYIDFVEYHLVENISIVINDGVNKKIMLQTNNDLLYLHSIIYTDNADDYHEMVNIEGKKIKLLYENTLIDIHRIVLPLFLFRDKQNHLPIKKMMDKNISALLVVKMAPLKKLFKNKIKEIPLLNVCLISNFINLAPSISVLQNNNSHDHVSQHNVSLNKQGNQISNTISQIPINIELKTQPIMYLYDKTHPIIIPIQTTPNPIYDVAIVPLDKFGFIKDFFFTIVEKEDFISNRINKFSEELIEMEILQLKEIPQAQTQKTLVLHSKLDSSMLNYYIPLKRLGHKLPNGIYYYSFSSDPKNNQILGGLLGIGYILRIKVKKMDGYIKFYANEYHKEII
jgi:hypothetical protein